MKQLIRSFLTPCGRLDRAGFWWRQLALAPLFFAGCFLYTFCMVFSGAWEVDFAEFLFMFLLLLSGSHVLSFLGFVGGGVLADALGHRLRESFAHQVPADHFLNAHADALMAVALVLLVLAAWCSMALILRRLRDARGGLAWLPACLPGLVGVLLWGLGLREVYAGAIAMVLCVISHALYCRTGSGGTGCGWVGRLFLSFVTPCGRLSRAGFWWRVTALAPLVLAGVFACCFGQLVLEGVARLPELNHPLVVPDIPMAIDASTLPNMLACAGGSAAAEALAYALRYEDIALPMNGRELISTGLALLLLTVWSSLALMLRRLRDTRLSTWPLLLCLSAPWLMLAKGLGAAPAVQACVWAASAALAHVLFCLPGKRPSTP